MRLFTLQAPTPKGTHLIPGIRLDTIGHSPGQERAALLIKGPSSKKIDKRVWADDELNDRIKALPSGVTMHGNKAGNTIWLYLADLNRDRWFTLPKPGSTSTTDALVMLVESLGTHFTQSGRPRVIEEIEWPKDGEVCHSRLIQIRRGTVITASSNRSYLWDGENLLLAQQLTIDRFRRENPGYPK